MPNHRRQCAAPVRHSLLGVLAAAAMLAGACTDRPTMLDPDIDPAFTRSGEMIPVIVVLDPATGPAKGAARRAEAASVAAGFGITPRHTYGTAIYGFAASVPAGLAQALARDHRVLRVEPDRLLERPIVLSESPAQAGSQIVPTGIMRIEVDRNPTVTTDGSGVVVDMDIAILDGGIDRTHPDLNVAGGQNFVGGNRNKWDVADDHGTHVAGTVAALDNGLGVVGVAPGARVWSVRVCGPRWCTEGDIVGGIDWIAERKAAYNARQSGGIDFAAANFSITSDDSANDCGNPANPTHQAICGVVETGVLFVMATGNNGRVKTPYPVAFAVSALADFDGLPGGEGEPTCRGGTDDTLAGFSNHGPDVDIAAPGVCIWSTLPGNTYGYMSGTSMAAPHVAGAVALYLHANRLPPASNADDARDIKDAIVGAGLPQGRDDHPCSYDDLWDRTGGPLLFANAVALGGDGTCRTDEEPPVPPEPGSISGTVSEGDSDQTLAGATVVVVGTDHSAITNGDGTYVIAGVPPGTYSVTASADGYVAETKTGIVVRAEETTGEVDFQLQPAPDNEPPVASFTFSCTYLACTFADTSTDTDGEIVAWSWTFGDGGTSNEQNPTHTYGEAGTYTVTLTVTDDDGASDTASQSLTVTAASGEPSVIVLAVTLRRAGPNGFAELVWSGATTSSVDIWRDGEKVATTSNSGSYSERLRAAGTYAYQVCEAGTDVCSNIAEVTY